MMSKLWTLFCLGLVLTSVYGQSCTDTASLRAFYNLTGVSDAMGVQPTQTISYCNSLKGAKICCSYNDVQSFQTKSDSQIAILTSQAGNRDTAFTAAGGLNLATVASSLNASVASFNTAVVAKGGNLTNLISQATAAGLLTNVGTYAGFGSFSTLVNPINAASPSNPVGFNGNPIPPAPGTISAGGNGNAGGNGANANATVSAGKRMLQQLGSNTQSTAINIYGVSANLATITAQLANATANVKTDLTTFQNARSTCVVALYQVQAAAWCLSCNVNATLNGYVAAYNTFLMGSDVCTRLKNACYPYLVASNLQNAVFNLNMLKSALAFASTALNNGTNPLGSTYTYTGQQPAGFPQNCTDQASCNWICTTLFNNGQVNTAALIDGGAVAATSSRLLSEEERLLQSANVNQFNPSADEAGTTVTFKADPSGVNPVLSGGNTGNSAMLTYGSVLGGMIAMIWSMMM